MPVHARKAVAQHGSAHGAREVLETRLVVRAAQYQRIGRTQLRLHEVGAAGRVDQRDTGSDQVLEPSGGAVGRCVRSGEGLPCDQPVAVEEGELRQAADCGPGAAQHRSGGGCRSVPGLRAPFEPGRIGHLLRPEQDASVKQLPLLAGLRASHSGEGDHHSVVVLGIEACQEFTERSRRSGARTCAVDHENIVPSVVQGGRRARLALFMDRLL